MTDSKQQNTPVNKIKIFANIITIGKDDKLNMISFSDHKGGSIGLVISSSNKGTAERAYVFQDATGDGKMDIQDETFLIDKANELFKSAKPSDNPITIFY